MAPVKLTRKELEKLREDYTAPPDPVCRVCGHSMRIGMAGEGRVEWFCDGPEANQKGLEWGSPEDREKTAHYWAGQRIQVKFGDERVIRLLDELARRECPEKKP